MEDVLLIIFWVLIGMAIMALFLRPAFIEKQEEIKELNEKVERRDEKIKALTSLLTLHKKHEDILKKRIEVEKEGKHNNGSNGN